MKKANSNIVEKKWNALLNSEPGMTIDLARRMLNERGYPAYRDFIVQWMLNHSKRLNKADQMLIACTGTTAGSDLAIDIVEKERSSAKLLEYATLNNFPNIAQEKALAILRKRGYQLAFELIRRKYWSGDLSDLDDWIYRRRGKTKESLMEAAKQLDPKSKHFPVLVRQLMKVVDGNDWGFIAWLLCRCSKEETVARYAMLQWIDSVFFDGNADFIEYLNRCGYMYHDRQDLLDSLLEKGLQKWGLTHVGYLAVGLGSPELRSRIADQLLQDEKTPSYTLQHMLRCVPERTEFIAAKLFERSRLEDLLELVRTKCSFSERALQKLLQDEAVRHSKLQDLADHLSSHDRASEAKRIMRALRKRTDWHVANL